MPIIGKLIQRSTAISFKRISRKSPDYKQQLEALRQNIEVAKKTKFGLAHHFTSLLQRTDFVSRYQQQVPITEYDTFYQSWLKDAISGAKDHIWPGRIKYFALSSGTTGTPSKRIPVTTEMIRSFQRVSLRQFSVLHELNLSDSFYGSKVLAVGGSTKLKKVGSHFEGDLSGILKKHTSLIAAPFAKPNKKITHLKDWKAKLPLMVEQAPKWNIGIMAGIPSWCVLLLEEIVRHYQLNSIHDIWPNFKVYVHGGVYMSPFIERLELKNTHLAYTISEVKPNIDYALVISTNAGLWRYMLGDLVRFLDTTTQEIIISGRIKQYLSICGEHLSLDNINQALTQVSNKNRLSLSEYTIFADEVNNQHCWFIGCDDGQSNDALMSEIDEQLQLLNDDYAYVRKHSMPAPTLKLVPTQTFYHYLESINKLGAQNKIPRVMNKDQAAQWTNFLSTNGYLET